MKTDYGTRSKVTHVNGIKVIHSYASSLTINGGHWLDLESGELWMTDGNKIAYCDPNKVCLDWDWMLISDVANAPGKDLFS